MGWRCLGNVFSSLITACLNPSRAFFSLRKQIKQHQFSMKILLQKVCGSQETKQMNSSEPLIGCEKGEIDAVEKRVGGSGKMNLSTSSRNGSLNGDDYVRDNLHFRSKTFLPELRTRLMKWFQSIDYFSRQFFPSLHSFRLPCKHQQALAGGNASQRWGSGRSEGVIWGATSEGPK